MNISKHRKTAFILAGLILLGGALLLAFPVSQPPAPAADVAAQTPAVHSDYGGMLLKMVISVGLVCLLAYAILRWGLGRLAGVQAGTERMEILDRLSVGPNRSIMVVRVASRFLVIGNTETGISLLSELSEEDACEFLVSQVSEE
ncbi:flagellar biosynthetic protein FliO [Persicimonas caeni]|uniref:Flagellar protein n=1 Tax=Persicimonas caeni TaxID=2292766 RepID=A0A4Y6PU63_PERCE|nr:flagellar biosynthetic protein FliO [Persicimonas caeni]QDG51659.1 flagellar biosynthetic protein FliO [Persicimonas caeni]QED32880.1 flagellar biosynthetic protein FliO [Persicimonas caeni]